MLQKTLLFLIFQLFVFGCMLKDKNKVKTTEINKICIASGGCFGTCPKLAIEINSNLNYRFYGGGYSKLKGIYQGKIEQKNWENICESLEKIEYKKLDSSYSHSVDDLSIETIIYYSTNKKHIYAQESSLPDSVRKVLLNILETYKKVELSQISNNEYDKFKFETEYQYGISPPPITEKIKFTPPN